MAPEPGSGDTPEPLPPALEPSAARQTPSDVDGKCFNLTPTRLGTPGDDTIRGTPGHDVILALEGDDHISGLRDSDVLCSGPGDDRIDDVGTPASPKGPWHYMSQIRIYSGAGSDDLTVGTAFRVATGTGDDSLTVTHQVLRAELGAGDDQLVSTGWGVDVVNLETGNDRVENNSPEHEAALRTCVQFDPTTSDMRVDLVAGTAVRSDQHGDQVRLGNIHCVSMGGGHNVVYGTPGDDQVQAGEGDMIVHAGEGRDELGGGDGNDRIYADGGPDSISGRGGADIVYSGPGNDAASGGPGNDLIYGAAGDDYLEGLGGMDHLEGGPGDDSLYAGSGCDRDVRRGPGGLMDSLPNKLYGGTGDDYLAGDRGSDRLDGGAGNDEGTGGWRDGGGNVITSVETLDPGCGVDD